MKLMRIFLVAFLLSAVHFANAQNAAHHPEIFDLSEVTVGAQRLDTLYLFAVGKWSDATIRAGAMSTEIHCYKRFGFCSVASADAYSEGPASVSVSNSDFDILRWDHAEIIAVDTSPICVMNTFRVDIAAKTITLSSTKKVDAAGEKDKFCKDIDTPTSVLGNSEDVVADIIKKK